MSEVENAINAAAYEEARARDAMIEAVVTSALQGGEHGVLITYGKDGQVTCEVSPEVPFGMIHEYRHGRFDR